jgi:hypothetical protein
MRVRASDAVATDTVVIGWLESAEVADFTRAAVRLRGADLLAAAKCQWIDLVEVCLELLLNFFGHSRELDPHADPGVARSNYSRGRDPLLVDPEIDL